MLAFLRRFATVSYGSAMGQLAAALASPLLSRLFTPADYGASGVVLSIAMMLLLAATMRYDEVIVSGRTPASRRNAFSLAFVMAAVISLLLLLAILVAQPARQRLGIDPAGSALLLFAPLILFLSVAEGRILPALLIQFDRLRLVSFGHLLNGAVGAAAQLLFGLLGSGGLGLLLGRTIGLIVAIAAMVAPAWRSVLVPVVGATRRRTMRQVLRAYRHQAYFLAPAGLMNSAAMQMPVFVLAASLGAAASGAYFFCQTLANASLSIYRRSITTMTAKEAQALIARGDPLMPFMLRLIGLVALLAGTGAALLFVHAERLIPFVFGAEWHQAGVAAKWMAIFYAASVIHLPASGLSTLLKFQRNMLVTQVGQFLTTALALALGVLSGDFELTVALVALGTAAVCGLHLLGVLRRIRAFDRGRNGLLLAASPAAAL